MGRKCAGEEEELSGRGGNIDSVGACDWKSGFSWEEVWNLYNGIRANAIVHQHGDYKLEEKKRSHREDVVMLLSL